MDRHGNGLDDGIWTGHRDFPLCTRPNVLGVRLNQIPGETVYKETLPGGRVIQAIALPVEEVNYCSKLIN